MKILTKVVCLLKVVDIINGQTGLFFEDLVPLRVSTKQPCNLALLKFSGMHMYFYESCAQISAVLAQGFI